MQNNTDNQQETNKIIEKLIKYTNTKTSIIRSSRVISEEINELYKQLLKVPNKMNLNKNLLLYLKNATYNLEKELNYESDIFDFHVDSLNKIIAENENQIQENELTNISGNLILNQGAEKTKTLCYLEKIKCDKVENLYALNVNFDLDLDQFVFMFPDLKFLFYTNNSKIDRLKKSSIEYSHFCSKVNVLEIPSTITSIK